MGFGYGSKSRAHHAHGPITGFKSNVIRVGIKKPTQKNPPQKTLKNPPKKPTKNVFLGFFGLFKFFIFYENNTNISLSNRFL
jgi:hypothetical protein